MPSFAERSAPSRERTQADVPAQVAPAPSVLLQLQRTAGNQAVAHMLAPARPQRALIQRIPGAGNYAKRRVKRGGKEGEIVEADGKFKYKVKWDDGEVESVQAKALAFVDEEKPTKSLIDSSDSEGEKAPTSTDEKSPSSSGENDPLKPTHLEVELDVIKGKTFVLTLTNANEKNLGTLSLKTAFAKDYINKKFLVNGPAKPTGGKWKIAEDATVTGLLLKAHLERRGKIKNRDKSDQEEQSAKSERLKTYDKDASVPGQKQLIEKLDEYHGQQKKDTASQGNTNLQMTRISLDHTYEISVGGKPRAITHLYTQIGNPIERRCYLGDGTGAYQRVHTSITNDDKEGQPSHTMVQTGAKMHIPNVRENPGAPRIGFDAEEGKTQGYGPRGLSVRGAKQSSAKGNYTAMDAKSLRPDEYDGSQLLAERFHKLLDLVITEVFHGKGARTVEKVSGFAVLDEVWEQDQRHSQTPEEEFLAPLREPMVSEDKALNDSVDTHPGVDRVLQQFAITHISGESWLCFARCVVLAVGGDESTLVAVHKKVREIDKHERGLIGRDGKGVSTGGSLADAILKAVFIVTGQQVSITLVKPVKDDEPQIAAGSFGGGREIVLLHTGAHFSLLRPKTQKPTKEEKKEEPEKGEFTKEDK